MIYGAVYNDNAMANANMTVWRFQVRQLYYREDYVIAKNSGHAAGVYGEIDYITYTGVLLSTSVISIRKTMLLPRISVMLPGSMVN
jgi:hypothetical protein